MLIREGRGSALVPQSLDLLELLGREQPPRHAPLGLKYQAVPIVLARPMHGPRCEVPLLAEPLEVAAVNDGLHLVFPGLRVLHPPSEFHAHERGKLATSEPIRNSPAFASTRRTRIRSGVISAAMGPNGLQNEPVLTTTTPEGLFHTPGLWVCPIATKR